VQHRRVALAVAACFAAGGGPPHQAARQGEAGLAQRGGDARPGSSLSCAWCGQQLRLVSPRLMVLKCIRFKESDGIIGGEATVTRHQLRYGLPSAEKALGALPVVAGFCRRLDIAGIVDRACPVRDIAYATHGQVIEALVANRLTSPAPLVHVEDWARAWAVEEVFGLSPEVLNDDRIGRALDAVAPELDGIAGSVGARAIAEFGVQVARIHWDMNAPRGALLYTRRSREEFGGRFLGLMAYLDPKGEGNNSMPGNQRPCPGVWGGALGDPRDMAKAGLPESQSPGDVTKPSAGKTPVTGAVSCIGMVMWPVHLRDAERFPVRELKEMSGTPKSRSTRMARTNVGSPKGREPYGDAGPVVVAGVTSCQGGREGRPQGEGGQVTGCSRARRHA
jgi:Domain of unknown function (DUF4277)